MALESLPATSAAPQTAANAASTPAASSSSASAGRPASAQPAGGSANPTGNVGTESDFLQALMQSLVPAEANAASAGNTKSKTNGDTESNTDSIAIAVALVSQALAGIVPGTQVTAPAGATSSATGGNFNSVATIGLTRSGGSSIQELVSLLMHQASDDAGSTATKGAGLDGSAVASSDKPASATADNAATASNMQLPVSSHLAAQHTPADSNASSNELRSTVGTPAWNDELGGRLTWMAHQGLESASLRLSPDHLGPLEVQISVRDGAATVWFGATQADTRAAIEQALPRLRELFATQGLTLADAGVSREPPRGQPQSFRAPTVTSISGVGDSEMSVTSAVSVRLGLVDTYA